MISEGGCEDELLIFHEVMRGSTSLVHLGAFDTMTWRGRMISYPRLLVGISIHYAICVKYTFPKSWVSCRSIIDALAVCLDYGFLTWKWSKIASS